MKVGKSFWQTTHGYLTELITTQRVEQVKWNAKTTSNKIQTSSRFFAFRENPIQYSNILHKRKYKKFELRYVHSDEEGSENWYIIEFHTERNKWSYTNRSYPTKYSGRVYIDKESFAVLKVVENWETALNRDEIGKYFKAQEIVKNISQITLKEENSVRFAAHKDGKYYAADFFRRSMSEKITYDGQLENSIIEISSNAFNIETEPSKNYRLNTAHR